MGNVSAENETTGGKTSTGEIVPFIKLIQSTKNSFILIYQTMMQIIVNFCDTTTNLISTLLGFNLEFVELNKLYY